MAPILVALASLTGGSALAATCPAERAVYRFESEDGPMDIRFVPSRHYASAASNLYLRLTTTQRSYWFGFSVSNGYSGITLLPVTDPTRADAEPDGPQDLLDRLGEDGVSDGLLANLRFYALGDDLSFAANPPVAGDPAPTYLMVPELGVALWYGPSALTDDPAAERDPMSRGVFRQVECLETAPDLAWP
jgi:hypothetical protein